MAAIAMAPNLCLYLPLAMPISTSRDYIES
jgi:hypothetical protein